MSDRVAGCDFGNPKGGPRPSPKRIFKIVHPTPGFQFFVIEFQKMVFGGYFCEPVRAAKPF